MNQRKAKRLRKEARKDLATLKDKAAQASAKQASGSNSQASEPDGSPKTVAEMPDEVTRAGVNMDFRPAKTQLKHEEAFKKLVAKQEDEINDLKARVLAGEEDRTAIPKLADKHVSEMKALHDQAQQDLDKTLAPPPPPDPSTTKLFDAEGRPVVPDTKEGHGV